MFDILIRDGQVVDGSGAPAFFADIGIRDGKLTVLRDGSQGVTARETISAKGQYVCPGFIDAHSHADMFYGQMPHALGKVSQGITTEVCGHCGATDFPTPRNAGYYEGFIKEVPRAGKIGREKTSSFAAFREYILETPKATHVRQLVGHNALRRCGLGSENRAPTDWELALMKDLLRECMEMGAAGLSSGLIYPPGAFAGQRELTELCKVVAEYGGVYTTHLRNEGDLVVESLREALDTAAEAGCKLTVSHHKTAGYQNWGKSEKTLQMIDEAIAAGQPVALDVYPYLASMTSLHTCLPPAEFAYPLEERLVRMQDPQIREQIRQQMRNAPGSKMHQFRSLEDVLLLNCRYTPQLQNKTVAQVARERGIDPVDALLDVVAENRYSATAAFFTMCSADLERIFLHDRAMLCTDALTYNLTDTSHPRGFCSFPEAIDLFVKQKKLLPLEQAVQKLSANAARWYGLEGKGMIRDGYDADLVILDLDDLKGGFTFGEEIKLCSGIEKVLVDGIVTYENKQLTGKMPGRLLLAK